MTVVQLAQPVAAPPVSPFAHVLALSDATGLFEHAELTIPRPEHGYCVDDVARGLVVLARRHTDPLQENENALLDRTTQTYLDFVTGLQAPDGTVANRRDIHGTRTDAHGVQDCWGRALWGLGTTAARSRNLSVCATALRQFDVSAHRRSPWPHAMGFAGLGAAEVLRLDSRHAAARSLLADAAVAVGRPGASPAWPWPHPRLTYANALIPDVLLAAGDTLGHDALIDDGLHLLGWLLDVETNGDHLSVTPAGGWSSGEPRPAFDQQAIEVATMADACARAFDLTGDLLWREAVHRAGAWFLGANDVGVPLYDDVTGGCCDGLEANGRNENQGAESTLALISTMQHVARLSR